jgi:hypothetical protein
MFFTRKVLGSLFALALTFLSGSLQASDDWYHVSLTSQDGVGILVDYQFIGGIYEPYIHQKYDVVDNIWINVHPSNSNLRPTDRVDVRIFNYRRPRTGIGVDNENNVWELEVSAYLKLYWNGSNFTGQWVGGDAYGGTTSRLPIASEGAMGTYDYRQEIVVTVYKDNSLYRLVDPISNSPFFKFNLGSNIKR